VLRRSRLGWSILDAAVSPWSLTIVTQLAQEHPSLVCNHHVPCSNHAAGLDGAYKVTQHGAHSERKIFKKIGPLISACARLSRRPAHPTVASARY
jgi:hypothetical protein